MDSLTAQDLAVGSGALGALVAALLLLYRVVIAPQTKAVIDAQASTTKIAAELRTATASAKEAAASAKEAAQAAARATEMAERVVLAHATQPHPIRRFPLAKGE